MDKKQNKCSNFTNIQGNLQSCKKVESASKIHHRAQVSKQENNSQKHLIQAL